MGKAKPIKVGDITYSTKGDATAFYRAMLNRYRPGDIVSAEDQQALIGLIQWHPDSKEKIGPGILEIGVMHADFNTQCFKLTRVDGSTEDFSYVECIRNAEPEVQK